MNALERDFLAASVDRRDAEQLVERRRVRRLRRLLVTTAVVAVVAMVAGMLAFRAQRRADDETARAEANAAAAEANAAAAAASAEDAAANAQLADERATDAESAQRQADLERLRAVALSTAPENPDLAALLAVEAHAIDPSLDSLDLLHRVLTAVPGWNGRIAGGLYLDGELLADGTTLVVAGRESIDVWDLKTRQLVVSIPHANGSETAELDVTADGRLAVARSGADASAVYDLAAGARVTTISHVAPVSDVAVSRDGSSIAAALANGTVEVRDVATGALESTLTTGPTPVAFVEWSPTADLVAAVTVESLVQLWDPAGSESLWTAPGLELEAVGAPRAFAAAFTPDGDHLAVVSGALDSRLRLFATSDGSEPYPPTLVGREGAGFPSDALFWVDADRFEVGVPNTSGIEIYDLTSGAQRRVLLEGVPTEDLVYSPVLDQVITVALGGLGFWAADGAGPLERVVPLTDAQQDALEIHSGSIHLSLAADGSRLLVSAFAFPAALPAATVYDLSGGEIVGEVFDATGPLTIGWGEFTLVVSLAGIQLLDAGLEPLGPGAPLPLDFNEVGASPDGRFFAVGRNGGLVDLYTADGALVTTFEMGPADAFADAFVGPSFTDDGRLIAANATDGRYAVWSTETLERIDIEAPGIVGALAGPWIWMLEPSDGTVQRYDPWTSAVVGEPLNPTPFGGSSRVNTANGRLAGASIDSVSVVDLATGMQVGRDLPYVGLRVGWTADGSVLAVPERDRVTLWNFDTDTWADIACAMAGRNLTEAEWQQLGPSSVDFRPTCPQYP